MKLSSATIVSDRLPFGTARSLTFVRPGLRFGTAPEKKKHLLHHSGFDRFCERVTVSLSTWFGRRYFEKTWLKRVDSRVETLNGISETELKAKLAQVRQELRKNPGSALLQIEVIAHIRLQCQRVIHLKPRPNQLLATRSLLLGQCVEMATGEGKTLSLALAAAAAALCGTPVHILTANDYLAARDSDSMGPLFMSLGLTCAHVSSSYKSDMRREAYASDIVYVTGKQVAFDWLRDELTMGRSGNILSRQMGELVRPDTEPGSKPVLRGLCLAFVDEADSLLVDEASTPVVLAVDAASPDEQNADAVVALTLAEQLLEGIHFQLVRSNRSVTLTDSGVTELQVLSKRLNHVWKSERYRHERIKQALIVIHLYEKDVDYLVRDKEVLLLDVHTGRVAKDRRLSAGLHRLLEHKETCTPSAEQHTVASIPVQYFFNRYQALAGASGTVKEVRIELKQVYGLNTVPISSHTPCIRTESGHRVFKDNADQLLALISTLEKLKESRRPVLIGTRSVDQSMAVSAMLKAHSWEHQVLNAHQDEDEAQTITNAGRAGQVTVATNMAGRGTDIPLEPGVNDSGGLHVVLLAVQDNSRLDRQLAGRAGRQGNRGSFEILYSLEDPNLKQMMISSHHRLCRFLIRREFQWPVVILIRLAQRLSERSGRKQRLKLYQSTESVDQALSFCGSKGHLA